MVFTIKAVVRGEYNAEFVFEDNGQYSAWLANDWLALAAKYKVTHESLSITPLNIGDQCYVSGDGDEVYSIVGVKQYAPYMYAFILDNGFCEGVQKCLPVR